LLAYSKSIEGALALWIVSMTLRGKPITLRFILPPGQAPEDHRYLVKEGNILVKEGNLPVPLGQKIPV
jgi:hypothetical protein